ncbi:MAG: phage tail tape measure protein [Candidatus Caldatribacteriota bacterium]
MTLNQMERLALSVKLTQSGNIDRRGIYGQSLDTKAAEASVERMNALFQKHASIVSELSLINSSFMQTMKGLMAADEGRLAVAKVKEKSLANEANLTKALAIFSSDLTVAQKAEALSTLGLAKGYEALAMAKKGSTAVTPSEVDKLRVGKTDFDSQVASLQAIDKAEKEVTKSRYEGAKASKKYREETEKRNFASQVASLKAIEQTENAVSQSLDMEATAIRKTREENDKRNFASQVASLKAQEQIEKQITVTLEKEALAIRKVNMENAKRNFASQVASLKRGELIDRGRITGATVSETEVALEKTLNSLKQERYRIQAQIGALTNAEILREEKRIALAQTDLAIRKAQTAEMRQRATLENMLASREKIMKAVPKAQQIGVMVDAGIASKYDAVAVAQKNLAKETAKSEKATKSFTTAQDKAATSSKNMYGAIRGVAGGLGQLWMAYGRIIPILAGFATAASLKSAFTSATEFEYLITYTSQLGVEAEQSKGKVADFNSTMSEMREAIFAMKDTVHTPIELAEGMRKLVKAGVDASTGIDALQTASQFATVAEVDMENATRALVTQLSAFGDQMTKYPSDAAKIAHIGDVIAKAANETVTDISELMNSLSYVTELAHITGASFEELSGALAMLSQKGVFASKSGQALRTSMQRLQVPTAKAQALFDKMGYSFSAFTAEGNKRGLVDIFTELSKFTEKLSDEEVAELSKELFGLRAAKAGVNVLKMMGGELESFIKQLEEADGYVKSVFDRLKDTSKVKLQRLKAELQETFIKSVDSKEFGEFVDSLTKFVSSPETLRGIQAVTKELQTFMEVLQQLVNIPAQLGADVVDTGLAAYVIFGHNPYARTIAAIYETNKKLEELNQTIAKGQTKKEGSIFAFDFEFPTIEKLQRDYREYEKATIDFVNSIAESISKKFKKQEVEVPVYLKPRTEVETVGEDWFSQLETKFTEFKISPALVVTNWNEELGKSAQQLRKNFGDINTRSREFGKKQSALWNDVERAFSDSIDSQLLSAEALIKSNDRLVAKTPQWKKGFSGILFNGEEVDTVYADYSTKASKFFETLVYMNENAFDRQTEVLNAYIQHVSAGFEKGVNDLKPLERELESIGNILNKSGKIDDSQIRKYKDSLEKLPEYYDKLKESAKTALDNIRDKQQKLTDSIKKYSEAISNIKFDKMTKIFDLTQDYNQGTIDKISDQYDELKDKVSELKKELEKEGISQSDYASTYESIVKYEEQIIRLGERRNKLEVEYYNTNIRKINELNKQGSALAKIAEKSEGPVRDEMAKQAMKYFEQALSYSEKLQETESGTISREKVYQDKLRAINEYSDRATKLNETLKTQDEDKLQALTELEKMTASLVEDITKVAELTKQAFNLDLNADNAKEEVKALREELESLFAFAEKGSYKVPTIETPDITRDFTQQIEKINGVFTNKLATEEISNKIATAFDGAIAATEDRYYIMWGNVLGSGVETGSEINKVLDKAARDREMTIKVNYVGLDEKSLGGVVSRSLGGAIPGYSSGIKLPGYGGGDRILAALESGEWILRKEVGAYYGDDFIKSINDMKFPKFATGGPTVRKNNADNEETVNLNISLNGNEPVNLHGTRANVNEFIRQFKDAQRFMSS